ncbi:MAG: ADP-forming succinate--CoA ligase subunit beta [Gemmataceae bacterium]|nr:ADP-forming succinate--CoA ligase subunit beta [Gemmataceae bacterium]MCI0741431.1 ADP-forming succinate--CoA ligase subunit beta [Gemmataceae bacterium]
MKIHEYQAKELLAAAGAAVPRGIVASSPAEAVAAFDQIGGKPVVLKAQIHAGGRGKGRFILARRASAGDKLSDFGGVKYLTKRDDVAAVAEVMFQYPLVTKQTGAEGQKVSKVLVQEAADIAREIYVGIVLDRAIGLPVLMACAEGGVEIEEVAAKSPEKILKAVIDPDAGLHLYQARRLAFELGFTGDQIAQAEKIVIALASVYLDKDCSLAEINPLVVTPKGEVVVLDAKITFDDNALFRHPDMETQRDEGEENPADLRAAKAGLTYIALNGTIGCLVNGAGLAMSTMDIIKYHGGEPANFLDVGGGVTPEGAIEAFRIILDDPKVKGVLVNIFGGIAKCDLVAEALVKAGREVGFKVPVVVRLEGTNVDKARVILDSARKELPTMQSATDLTDAAKKVVAAAKG